MKSLISIYASEIRNRRLLSRNCHLMLDVTSRFLYPKCAVLYRHWSRNGLKDSIILVTTLKLSVYLWLYSPFLNLDPFSVSLSLYTVRRTSWTGDQPFARPLPAHTRQQRHRIKAHRLPCLKWNLNPRPQCLSG
jgi:hypothetical protein